MAAITLSRTGQKMPLVGFGLWKVTQSTCADTVYNAIKAGYRLFDCAADYGNEKEAGLGVKRAIDDGLVKREELFITSKLWNAFHAREHVASLARKQLADWQLTYFDLFLVHFPIAIQYIDPAHRYPPGWQGDDGKVHLQNTPMQETWAAMEQLVDEKLVVNIGMSNANGSILSDILRYARYPPQVLQIELHPYLTQEPMVSFAKTLGIAITAYSSFGPTGWEELGMTKGAASLFEVSAVAEVAKKHSRTPAQVLLRWATQRDIAVVPKSNNHARLIENLQCLDFTISESDMKAINSLNCGLRLNDPADIDPRMAIFA